MCVWEGGLERRGWGWGGREKNKVKENRALHGCGNSHYPSHIKNIM